MIDEGSGPVVLLLHGSGPGTTSAAWKPLVSALADRFRVVAPDLLGFGESPAPSDRSLRAAWTAQAASMLDSLGVTSCAVVGNSAGGAIALSLACARPRAVERVVAVGTMGHPMTLPSGLDALWRSEATEQAARELLGLIFRDPAAVTPAAVAARLDAMRAQPGYGALFPPPRQRWVDDLSLTADEFRSLSAPVLLVHGSEDPIVPLAASSLPLVSLLSDARLHVFGRAAHATPLERTGEFNRLVRTFLEADR